MQVLSWLTGAVALGINVHAGAALVLGLRSRDAAVIARHARRCAWSAAGFVLLAALGLAASVITSDELPGDDPSQRASRLAMSISEVMNCTAFTVLVALLPLIAAAVLHWRRASLRP